MANIGHPRGYTRPLCVYECGQASATWLPQPHSHNPWTQATTLSLMMLCEDNNTSTPTHSPITRTATPMAKGNYPHIIRPHLPLRVRTLQTCPSEFLPGLKSWPANGSRGRSCNRWLIGRFVGRYHAPLDTTFLLIQNISSIKISDPDSGCGPS